MPHSVGVWLYLRAYAGGVAPKRILLVTNIVDGAVKAIPLERGNHLKIAESIPPDRWTYWAGPFSSEAFAFEALADRQYVPKWI